jgi:predicted O-methyltransferase YrrM
MSEDLKEQIKETIKNSPSYEVLKTILTRIKSFHHHTHILYDLRTLLGEKCVYVEIGSYCGASAALMLQHPQTTSVYCIDSLVLPPTHYKGCMSHEETLKKNLEFFKGENEYEIWKGFSHSPEILSKVKELHIDLLFIDGDHTYQAVWRDFENYHPLVNPGGFIVFDDYLDSLHSPQVRFAVDDIVHYIRKEHLPYEIIGSLPNYQQAFSSVPRDHLTGFILYKTSQS